MASGITDSSLKYHLQNAKNHRLYSCEILMANISPPKIISFSIKADGAIRERLSLIHISELDKEIEVYLKELGLVE